MRSDAREPTHDDSDTGGDRQWDLAVDIAADLWLYGEYVVELNPFTAQRMVDVHWAALQAGRLLGARAKIHVGERRHLADPRVTVSVTYLDPNGRGLERVQAGLDALLQSVHAARAYQDAHVPTPRGGS